ncbi:hypothetical protein [Cobetia sp. 5-11-6-3]|uniref:hypothetical protein n=1 Tax=Cobetia sp. 5-11-6-3 TaxID=2737458 RepID=UPI0015970FB2|nr:hypothetical protein [Cobetia sp. 5-11-6-3]
MLQVSLLPMDNDLFSRSDLTKDIRVFEKSLSNPHAYNDKYSIKVITVEPVEGFMAGVISRRTKVKYHDRDFQLHHAEDFPPVVWLWDRDEQVILIENRRSVFGNATTASRALEKIANNYTMIEYMMRVHIRPKSVESRFWDTFESFEYVYEVRLNMFSPNLFGKTKKEIGDFLHEVEDETNATEFTPVFKNPDGNLNLKKSNWLTSMIDWIKDGAGDWTIRGKKDASDKCKVISSKQKVKVLNIKENITEIELENCSPQYVADLLKALRDGYTYKK